MQARDRAALDYERSVVRNDLTGKDSAAPAGGSGRGGRHGRAGAPLALAGLWEPLRNPESGKDTLSATVIVGPANARMQRFHGRMAVILDWRDAGARLIGAHPAALPRTAPEEALQEWIISPRVNRSDVNDDDAELIEPLAHARVG